MKEGRETQFSAALMGMLGVCVAAVDRKQAHI